MFFASDGGKRRAETSSITTKGSGDNGHAEAIELVSPGGAEVVKEAQAGTHVTAPNGPRRIRAQ